MLFLGDAFPRLSDFFFLFSYLFHDIPDVADRLDMRAVFSKLLPESLDVHVHRPGLALKLRIPHPLHDHLSCHDDAGVSHEKL